MMKLSITISLGYQQCLLSFLLGKILARGLHGLRFLP